MVWDALAVRVGVNAIGTVESNLTYDAINFGDPITVGFVQWFGVRAAAILTRMRLENPTDWSGVIDPIKSDLLSHTPTDRWWNSRRLTLAEGNSIKPILNKPANKLVQDNQMSIDLAGYRVVAVNSGMNANTNTKSVLFFCTMYHQSPSAAARVLAAATLNCSLERIRDEALADRTLGQYASRQNTAYAIINAMNPGSVGTGGTLPPVGDPSEPPEVDQTPAKNNVSYVRVDGSRLTIFTKGGAIECYLATTDRYIPVSGGSISSNVPDDPDIPGPIDPGDPSVPGSPAPISPVNDYPFKTRPIGQASPYLFYYRECVDYCAWMVRTRTRHKSFTNGYKGTRWGNANTWDNAAVRVGIPVNGTPAVGSVAFRNRGAYGHVAFVYKVNADGSFGTMEYNSLNDHEYHTYNPADESRFDGFIHFEK